MGGTALDSKQRAKNSAVESLADDASQTEQGRNMSPTAADDRTNIVPEDYLDAENINNNNIIHVNELQNDSIQENYRSKHHRESNFHMKADDE